MGAIDVDEIGAGEQSGRARYSNIAALVLGTPWAILPDKLAIILDVLAFRVAGGRLTAGEIRERLGEPAAATAMPRAAAGQGAIAVLQLYGVIAQHAGMMVESSGGTSTERFMAMFRQALADPNVKAIVIDIDSPGGLAAGIEELSAEIYASRGQKPILAVATGVAASAAYWIGTSADELNVTPSGRVGSIGVIYAHDDSSQALAAEGVSRTLISAGKYKTEGNPWQPLNEEARQALQAWVDEMYGMFVGAVARNRGASQADVRNGFGEGRMVSARQAVELGMADRVATLEATITRAAWLAGRRRSGAGAGAAAGEFTAEGAESAERDTAVDSAGLQDAGESARLANWLEWLDLAELGA